MRIYLIGLPGVGKSTIGNELAKQLGYSFIDLDTYIEEQAMLFVDEIFHLYGEEYFRVLETNSLQEVSKIQNVVIACGGGIVKTRKNKDIINGPCIYLKANLKEIEERLLDSPIERPILARKGITELFEERKDQYKEFQTIEIENHSINQCVGDILRELNLR
ncbi:MAG: AAA family ATPase [Anaeroplasmataceae bacterium]|nr:AAA family ATPase [Anaeroplasmataceae bacterium]